VENSLPYPDSGCDEVIALISTRTRNADGARWEMRCAAEEGKPLLGVHIQKDDKGVVPSELIGYPVIEWSWDGMASFITTTTLALLLQFLIIRHISAIGSRVPPTGSRRSAADHYIWRSHSPERRLYDVYVKTAKVVAGYSVTNG
jgi:hypothetical protein